MNPEAALFRARRSIAEARSVRHVGDRLAALERLSEAFEGLDRWLSLGGHLPADWAPHEEGDPPDAVRGYQHR